MKTYPCPTPWRIGHPNQTLADRQRINDSFNHRATLYPYQCRCGEWHLTPNLAEELPTLLEAGPADIARLTTMSNSAFRDLVDADVKKTADGRDRIALRHPNLLTRWRWVLKALLRDVHTQLDDDGTPEWREKATAYEQAVRARTAECRALRQHAQQLAA